MTWSSAAVAALLAGSLCTSACTQAKPRPGHETESERAEFASKVTASARHAAVAKIGANICQYVRVGISEKDLVRGTVKEIGPDRIRIQVDEPGRFPKTLDGVAIVRGAMVWEPVNNWTPCT